ncbi:hypothetical protein D6C85_10300, partial [Aureobasidium pullulans]
LQDVKRRKDNSRREGVHNKARPSKLPAALLPLHHSRHTDVQLCLSPSDIPSSTILATRCLKDTRPPNRALLQPAALHSRRAHWLQAYTSSPFTPSTNCSALLFLPGAKGHALATFERVSEVQRFRAAHPTQAVLFGSTTTNDIDNQSHGGVSPTQVASFGSNNQISQ